MPCLHRAANICSTTHHLAGLITVVIEPPSLRFSMPEPGEIVVFMKRIIRPEHATLIPLATLVEIPSFALI